MFLRSTFAVAGFAACTSAFLVPSSVTLADADIVTTLPFDLATQSDGRVIKLDCPGCAVLVGKAEDGFALMTTGLESELQLDFEIQHLKAADVLTLNGVQLFPISLELNAEPLTATQTITSPKVLSGPTPDEFQVSIGYESRINLVKPPTQDEQLALYYLRIQIVAVGGQWVDDLEVVEMKLIATPAGGLLIADIIKAPTTNPATAPGAACTTMICKFKSVLDSKISQIKPVMGLSKGSSCGGERKGINRHGQSGGKHGKDGFRHGRHGPHHHRHHSRVHRFLHAMKSIAVQVLIPVSIGIACGIAASFIGMVVGHSIVFFWRTLYRRGQAPVYRTIVKLDVKAPMDPEAPPAYNGADAELIQEKSTHM